MRLLLILYKLYNVWLCYAGGGGRGKGKGRESGSDFKRSYLETVRDNTIIMVLVFE